MGAECCKNRKIKSLDPKVHDSVPNTVVLRTTGAGSNSNHKSPPSIENDENDATQQLLPHKPSENSTNSNHNDYLSINNIKSTLQQQADVHHETDRDPPNKSEVQTPPIIKALFGSNHSQPNDINECIETPPHPQIQPHTQHTHTATISHRSPHPHATPMGLGGDVYLGFAGTDRSVPLSFPSRPNRNSIVDETRTTTTSAVDIGPPTHIIRNCSSQSSNSSSSSSSSTSLSEDDDDDWIPDKSSLLMGFAEENDMISSFNAGDPLEFDPCTLSTMSLNSAHLADMVITGVRGPSSSLSSLKSFRLKHQQQMEWITATFNLLIEYFPYKHIMQQIYWYCAVDIAAVDGFVFPSTVELENKYNYYDTPHLFIENVSSTNKHQPCLVLMIGPPGSGKSSYANYRYGKQCVVAADDYFDIHHAGQFIGSEVKEAHRYCQEQVLARLYKKETVVVANTHSTYWQLYDKIIPVLFDGTLPHKIVFALMPETNATSLVRRCVHSCTKPKIIGYIQSIRCMLKDGGGVISTDKVLKYGRIKDGGNDIHKIDQFEYGLWIDADGYRSVQDWYQHKTNTNLMCDIGDGRISPIIECTWPVFKKAFKKWMVLSKFTSENDPVIDLEVRIIGFVKHRIAQMVAIEVIQPIIKHNEKQYTKSKMESAFWRMFKREIHTNMESMGCVLAMRKSIPFNTAKYVFDYNCIEYINDGPIVKAKLATKRYVRNYIKYYTPPPPIHCDLNMMKTHSSSNNMFFNLGGVLSSRELLPTPDHHKGAVIDKSSFALKLREKHIHSNGGFMQWNAKQNNNNNNNINLNVNNDISLNPDAKEFKMEAKEKERLNPAAMEFKPKPQPQMPFLDLLRNMNTAPLLPQTQTWFPQGAPPPPPLLQNNLNFLLQTQQTQPLLQAPPIPTHHNAVWNVAAMEKKSDVVFNPKASEFTPQQQVHLPSATAPVKFGSIQPNNNNNNNPFQAAPQAQTHGIDYSGMAAYANVEQNVSYLQSTQPQINHVHAAVHPNGSMNANAVSFVPNMQQSNGIMNGNIYNQNTNNNNNITSHNHNDNNDNNNTMFNGV